MNRTKKTERLIVLTKILTENPYHLLSFTDFCEKFDVAKSTISEDVLTIKEALSLYGLGKVETLHGITGGVRFIPGHPPEDDRRFLESLAKRLAVPERILPGRILYTTDVFCQPEIVVRLGEIFMLRLQQLSPDCIMTVETSGIPLALEIARAFNVPLVIARHSSDIREGSTVNINYVTGAAHTVQTMAMPKRALKPGSKVLIVDDVMKGGGTAKGMVTLATEVGARVVGKAFLIANSQPEEKLIDDYLAFFILDALDEKDQIVKISINPGLSF